MREKFLVTAPAAAETNVQPVDLNWTPVMWKLMDTKALQRVIGLLLAIYYIYTRSLVVSAATAKVLAFVLINFKFDSIRVRRRARA